MAANEQLWQSERAARRRLIRRAFLTVVTLAFPLILLLVWLAQPILIIPGSAHYGLSDPGRLRGHVEKLSNEFYPRSHVDQVNLNKAADYITAEFQKYGGAVSSQNFRVDGAEHRNVVLKLGPPEGARIVIGAHYDAASNTRGADDNASGVAGLLELARILKTEELSSRVELVAFSLEEPPYFGTEQMGSYFYAKSLADQEAAVKMMVSLEMIGYFSDDPGSQSFPFIIGQLIYPSRGNFVTIVGNFTNAITVRKFKSAMLSVAGLDTYSLNCPAFVPGIDFSDHRNFWRFGYDAVMVTDTAYFRNRAYHTPGDTADRLDYAKMARVVDGVRAAVVAATKE